MCFLLPLNTLSPWNVILHRIFLLSDTLFQQCTSPTAICSSFGWVYMSPQNKQTALWSCSRWQGPRPHTTHISRVFMYFFLRFLLGTASPRLWLGGYGMKWLFQGYFILTSSKRKTYWAIWCLYAVNQSAVSRDNLEISFKSTLLMKTKSSCRHIQCFLKGILNLSSLICKVILGNTAELIWVMYL